MMPAHISLTALFSWMLHKATSLASCGRGGVPCRRWRCGAVGFTSALLLAACGSSGGADRDGTTGDGTADFPVTWTYDSIEWSITDVEIERDQSDDLALVADIRITNLLPTDVDAIEQGQATSPANAWLNVSLATSDEVTIARGDSFEIPSIGEGESTEGTWTFPVEEEPDLADLILVMDHEDRTPAVVPFDGETFDLPESIPAEIDADEVVETAVSCGGHWGVHEMSEFEAEVGWIDHLGVRARPDHRLLAVDLEFLQAGTGLGDRLSCDFGYVYGDTMYVEVDGDQVHPARAWPADAYEPNDSGSETLVFEVSRDAEEIVFVIAGSENDGEAPEVFRFPVTYDELPICCEE